MVSTLMMDGGDDCAYGDGSSRYMETRKESRVDGGCRM